jgi:hypothetical protein
MSKLGTSLLGPAFTGLMPVRLPEDDAVMSRGTPAPRTRESFLDRRMRLPDGRVGKVYMIEYGVGGYEMVVSIFPEGEKSRFFGLIKPKPVRFADSEIDLLVEVPTEAEIQGILDDPEAHGLED